MGLAIVAALALYFTGAPLTLRVVSGLVHWSAPDVEEIRGADLARLGPGSAVLLDIRSAAEFEVSHLAGARRLEPDAPLTGEILAVPRDTLVVVYCAVGRRSARAAEALRVAGFSRVRNLTGGIFQWGRDGRHLIGPTPLRVHGYSRLWSWLLPGTLRAPV